MKKNSFISVISHEQKEENKGSVEFQVSVLPIRYENLLPIWNSTKKTIHLSEVYEKFWENVNDYWLICQKKNGVRYKELISRLNIRELKTR